ncbi:MAG: ESX secretion-associated protein EspG [Pseudonocardiaceae bacterium]
MRWQLSAAQWDVLTEWLGLEGYPAPLRVRSHGHTDVERARVRAEVSAELGQLGLLRGGRVDADLEAALRLLHRPSAWVRSVWLPDNAADQPVRVVAAQGGRAGVCAAQYPDPPGATMLEVIPAAALAAAVVAKLPPHPPGRSPAVTLSLEVNTAPDRGVLVTVPTARTSAERSRAAAAAILDQPHSRAGQIAAVVRDPSGRVRRSDVLRWCDNPDGRYQVTISRGPRGPESLVVAPGDPHRLGAGVQRLLASVQPR